jgi:hypothetical protein
VRAGYRDINAGNIVLSADAMPEPGAEGFLLDLDCASIAVSSAGIVEGAVSQINHAPGDGMDSPSHAAAWSVSILVIQL